jgi:DNA polymerase-3 subunit delta'
MADKLNTAAANKLLKLLEEPTERTVFILIWKRRRYHSNHSSRCQVLHFNGLPSQYRRSLSFEKNIDPKIALKIAHQAQEISTKHCNYNHSESVFLKNGL